MTVALGLIEPSAPTSLAAMMAANERVGRTVDWFNVYREWDQIPVASDFTNAAAVRAGVVVTLEPRTVAAQTVAIDHVAIAAGTHDTYLGQWAAVMAAAPCPVMLRFSHEMNGTWYPWGNPTGNTNAGQGFTPAQHIAAYRHVVSLFRAQAPNVKHFWCPNVNPDDNPILPWTDWWVGDAWCDYVGTDGYNWVAVKSASWLTFRFVHLSNYQLMRSVSSKPFIVGEMSCNPVGAPTGTDKAHWITEAFLKTIPQEMADTYAVFWFNFNKEADWRIDSDPASHAAFRRVAIDSLYGGSGLIRSSRRRASASGRFGASGL
jgi:hypothetical protein